MAKFKAMRRAGAMVVVLVLSLLPSSAFGQGLGVFGPPTFPLTGQFGPPLTISPANTGIRGPGLYGQAFGNLQPSPLAFFQGFGAPGGTIPQYGFGTPMAPNGQYTINGGGPWNDSRNNQSRQPVLTMFNGQTSSMQIQDFHWTPTNVQVIQGPGGQTVFVPQYQPIPMPYNLTVQAVQSPDGRFNRLNLAPSFVYPNMGPPFPITSFPTPVFEGGAQGLPNPFTQIVPDFSPLAVNINTTVVVPEGGRAMMGGFNWQNQNRNESGPPILSKIPIFNRPFNQITWGRDMNRNMFEAPKINVMDRKIVEPDDN